MARRFQGMLSLAIVLALATLVTAQEHTKDSLDTVKSNLKGKKAVLVDVREKSEWDEGHLQGAKLLPLSKLQKNKELGKKKLKEGIIVYTHCRAGRRALTAGAILAEQGYDVRPLKQGYEQLLEAGFAKAKPKKKKKDG